MTFRSYRDLTGADRSGLLDQVVAQRERVARRLNRVRAVVAVMSGKGGVGKSYVTAVLAKGAADAGKRVGVLDADLKSPTCARLLGARGPVRILEDGAQPVVGVGGIRLFSTDLLLGEGNPLAWNEPVSERFIWRGTLETGALREFLSDVAWGDLDLLMVDLPPGADRLDDLAALVPDMRGALAVTIPSEESRMSVERSIRAALSAGIPLLGIVENMTGYECEHCGRQGPLFTGTAGDQLAATFGLPVVGRIPFRTPGNDSHQAQSPATKALLEAFLGVAT